MSGSDPKMMANLALTEFVGRRLERPKRKLSRFFKGRKAVRYILPMLNL